MKHALFGSVVAALVVAACGSTVQMHGSATLGSDGGTGLTARGTGVGQSHAGLTGAGTAGGAGAGVAGGGGTVGGISSTAGQGPQGGPGGSPQLATAPPAGTTLAPIQVGILLYPDLSAFANTFGASADAGDQSLEVDTAVNWINTHGGAAGHQIQAVKHNVSLTSSDTYDQLAQQACQDFTADHHVVAVLAPGTAVSDNFAACLQAKGVLLIDSGHWVHDATDWKQYSNLFSPNEADGSALGRAMVNQVLSRPLAKSGDKVGLMVMTEPGAVRTADNVVKPQLKAAGIEVVEYTVPPPASTADISNSVSVDDSAELKMASQGIHTVLFLCPGCLGFFAKNADSQKYYPLYLGSSLDGPGGITGSASNASMKTAIMLGYQPDSDIGLYTHPSELTDNPTRALCKQIMAPSHQSSGDVSEFATQAVCDGFLDVKYAAELNPANPLTGPALQAGMGQFGSARPCALNFSTYLTSAQHGGDSSYRLMHWDSGSSTFVYDNTTRLAFR